MSFPVTRPARFFKVLLTFAALAGLIVNLSKIAAAEDRLPEKTPPSGEKMALPEGEDAYEREIKAHAGRAKAAAANFLTNKQEGSGAAPKSAVPKPSRKVVRKVTPGEPNPHEYSGFIDASSISLTMTVYNGKVHGDFYFLRAPTTLYTFSGANDKEGSLNFSVYSDQGPFAKAKLKKDPRVKNSILWDGTMQTADKKSLRLFLNRPLKPGATTEWPTSVEEFDNLKGFELYEGTIIDGGGGKATAAFKLKFSGIKCEGFYYQVYPSGKVSFIFHLEGQNPEGLLTLREFDDEGMSAELYLTKTMTGNLVSWHGDMTNHRFKQVVKKVEFHHTLGSKR